MTMFFGVDSGLTAQDKISALESGVELEPFIRANSYDEEKLLKWLTRAYEKHYRDNDDRIKRAKAYVALYRGRNSAEELSAFYEYLGIQTRGRRTGYKVMANHIRRIIEEEVTSVMRYNKDIAVVPGTEDFQDRIEAETLEAYLYTLRKKQRRYKFLANAAKDSRIYGCAIGYVGWDTNAGNELSGSKSSRAKGSKFSVELDNGEKVEIKRPVYEGEVEVKLMPMWDVGLQPYKTIENVDWCFIREFYEVDEVIADYEHVLTEEQIDKLYRECTPARSVFSAEEGYPLALKNHLIKVTFFHRKTPYVPTGAKVVFTLGPDIMLSRDGLELPPHRFGTLTRGLPIEILYDMYLPSEPYGISRIEDIANLQAEYNNTYTSLARNIRIASVPRLVAPYGTFKPSRAKADVQTWFYRGGVEPNLKTFPVVGQEAFAFKAELRDEMQKIYRAKTDVTDLGSNIRSAGQMQIIESDQEESEAVMAEDFRTFALNIENRVLSEISEHYADDDNRFYEVLGVTGKWMLKNFDVKSLSKPWELDVQLSDDLPKRKDRRMQTVMQMSQIWPTLFPAEAIADMFKMGQSDKFFTGATIGHKKAEQENALIRQGQKVPPPEHTDDHFVHWASHDKQLQSPEMSEWPEARKQALTDHFATTERFIMEKMASNPMYAQAAMAQLKGFPKVFPWMPSPQELEGTSPQPPAPPTAMGPEAGGGLGGGLGGEIGGMTPAQVVGPAGGMSMPDVMQQRGADGTFGGTNEPIM